MDLTAEVRAVATALSAALRAGQVPRALRARARAALAAAFAACEAGRADLTLLRHLDALACPLVARIPAPPRLRPTFVRGAVDRSLVERLWGPVRLTDRLTARIDRSLAVTGAEGIGTLLRAPKIGNPEPAEMEFTRG